MKIWLLVVGVTIGCALLIGLALRTSDESQRARESSFDQRVKACVDDAIARDRKATRAQYEPICRATTQRSQDRLPDIRPSQNSN